MNENPKISKWSKLPRVLRWLIWVVVCFPVVFVVLAGCHSRGLAEWGGLAFLMAASLVVATLIAFLPSVIKWLCHWRNLRRVLFPLACVATIIASFYAEEDWRGWYDWKQFQQQWAAKGEHFDWASVVPAPVPDDQNFAMTPVVFTAYGWILDRTGHKVPYNTNIVNRLMMDYYHGNHNPPDTKGDWARGIKTDFTGLQLFYRGLAAKTNLYPVPAVAQSPAADVLVSLARFAPTIEDLRQAAQLPYSRFPLDYDAGNPAQIILPHLAGIKRAGEVVQLRALAELQTGDTGQALADLQLVQRLANSMRSEPIIISHMVRMNMVRWVLQSVWEGLADHRWSDAQLVSLETGLAKLDFLADYKTAVHGEMAMQCNYIGYLREHPEDFYAMADGVDDDSAERSPEGTLLRWHLVPGGWICQNQLTCARVSEEYDLPVVDLETRTCSPKFVRQADSLYIAGRMALTPYNMIERRIIMSPIGFSIRCAFAQSSVDLARVAIALERYRLAHGQFPNALDNLKPQFLNAVPHDIIGGRPLHYRLTDDGQFVLYSVGWNQTDDGGVVALNKGTPPTMDMSEGDWVWSYDTKSQ